MSDFLICDSVQKWFDGRRVLEDVSFALKRGECLALLGASGCGKTTLLNIIAGFLKADGGEVACDGRVLDKGEVHVPIALRKFAMVFQDFSLWPHMTVGQNVAFGLRMLGVSRAQQAGRARRALERVGLESRMDDHPAQLSGGQQQRVAIARALVVEPRILLLDEPLSALDARMRDELRDEIAALVRELEITAVYVTHDQIEALTVAHRVAVMNAGRIEQLDTPERIYREPANAFVASFLGAANVLGGPDGSQWMVRREAVSFLPGGPGAEGRCETCRFLGERYEITARTADGIVRGYSPAAFAPGSLLEIRIPAAARRDLN